MRLQEHGLMAAAAQAEGALHDKVAGLV